MLRMSIEVVKLMCATDPNDNIYSTATNISGPWSDWQLFAANGSNTFSSQTADIFSANGVVMYFIRKEIDGNVK